VARWRTLGHDGAVLTGAALAGLAILGALLAPWLTPWDPLAVDLDQAMSPPSLHHPMGTDALGRDLLSRILHGGRISLGISLAARTMSLVLGLLLGGAAGYAGGRLDSLVMRLADVTFAFPGLLLLIAVTAMLEPGVVPMILALGVVGWAGMARLVRAQVLSVREKEFILAARSLGLPATRIFLRHVLPNCLSVIVVAFTLGLGLTILAESSLSFLGLGIPPPSPSWGVMVAAGRDLIRTAPWVALFPGLAIGAAVLGFNLLGEGLRDVLDPRLSTARLDR
jgi:peptide/nickel transport system permease protein